jgi:hypothetical protein
MTSDECTRRAFLAGLAGPAVAACAAAVPDASPGGSMNLRLRLQPGHDRVVRQIREDFAHGRVVVLDGWVLSETEARLCAVMTDL